MSKFLTKPGQEFKPDLNLVFEYTQQTFDEVSFQAQLQGNIAITGTPMDAGAVDTISWNVTQIQAALAGRSFVFVENGSVDLPRVLLAIDIEWDISSAAGSYSENGTGASAGNSVSLQLTAQGRAQGSAAVVPELIPVWYSLWTNDLPVVDYYFFMLDNSTRAQVLTKASTIASIFLGGATTILDWPNWQPVEQNFSLAGQKVSASAEAVARCSVSINSGGDVSETTSSGSGASYDKGHSMRPVNIPLCLNPGITIPSPTMTEEVVIGAGAVITAGINFPGESASATASATAQGMISPSFIEATAQTGYPETGIYGKIESQQFQYGYSSYRVRTFDFSTLPHAPQITTVDFFGTTGAAFAEVGPGQAVILAFRISTVVIGIWFFISTETQPDLSAYGVTNYLKVTITSGDNAATLASKTQTAFAASFSADATATVVNGGGTNSAVKLVDTVNGPSNPFIYNTTNANVILTQRGT